MPRQRAKAKHKGVLLMYYIVMKQTDGPLASIYLNKCSYWKIKTAKKHLQGLVREQVAGGYGDVKYFSLQLV